jgi:NADH dehydrogenase ubiquinone Fe-S protein 4
MTARIYKPAKTAMQSGRAKTHLWVLEYEPASPKDVDPLMGWTGSSDMKADELRLKFESREAAIDYATRHGIAYRVEDQHERRVRPKSYADNFRWQRP